LSRPKNPYETKLRIAITKQSKTWLVKNSIFIGKQEIERNCYFALAHVVTAVWNKSLTDMPIRPIIAKQTIAIAETIMAYSTIVAPLIFLIEDI
jgi:hypothetical protein